MAQFSAKFLIMAVSIISVVSEAQTMSPVLQDNETLHSIRSFLDQNYNLNSTVLQQWLRNNDGNPCRWLGVVCRYLQSKSQEEITVRVTGLNLSSASLSGPLPPALANLSALNYLILANNSFNGTIPENPKLLEASLEVLDLSSNKITGEIPKLLFSGCSRLRVLNLSGNEINGSLPVELKNCKNLRQLILNNNNLTGRIPDGLCGNLRELDLEHNELSGNLTPAVHVSCGTLTALRLATNHLSGQLPKEIATLAKLDTLVLGKNNFSGSIPPEFGRLRALKLLSIDNNKLSGAIPPSLGQMLSLQTLLLHKNQLNGTIPRALSSLPKLRILDLNNNNLTGSIPAELGNLRSLNLLYAGDNSLTGTIPLEIGNLTELQGLDLSGNRLTGVIPATIKNLKSLLWFSVSHNRLQGNLPPDIVECSSLVWLNVAHNRLSGAIPAKIGLIGARANETFTRNRKSPGFIPDTVGGCWAMSKWYPEENPFIHDTFKRVRCNNFWQHIFQGTMPAPICVNHPDSSYIPAYIQLSGNRFTGSIPESLSNYSRLGALLVADNLLAGPIPEAITGLSRLFYLNLSHNNLNGAIPETLGRLTCLIMLDLSANNFSGGIPPSLSKLTSLSKFNVSYNVNLQGPVPTGGQLTTFRNDSYYGDPGLHFEFVQGRRGQTNYTSSGSKNTTQVSGSNPGNLQRWKIGGISIGIAAAGVAILGVLGCCLLGVRNEGFRSSSDRTGSLDQTYRSGSSLSLTYANILKATDNFSDSRCIGKGGQGAVYRAELKGSLHVAVKLLCHEDTQADVEFLAEIQTLGGLSHPNLVPLLGCCLRGNERILVYKLIENGSLEDWLHEPPRMLEWPPRLKIALGCSLALRFLHHECSSVIIHRDIKSSNILLDGDFNAYVADFGLARNQSKDMTHVSTSVAGTLGYLPPEYAYSGQATTKGDVYSFGVILMQLATGLRAIGVDDELEGGLVVWVRAMVANGRIQRILDPRVMDDDTSDKESGVELLRLACNCTHDMPQLRPSMVEVTSALQEINDFVFSKCPRQF